MGLIMVLVTKQNYRVIFETIVYLNILYTNIYLDKCFILL